GAACHVDDGKLPVVAAAEHPGAGAAADRASGVARVVPELCPAPARAGRSGTYFRRRSGSPAGCRRCGLPSWPAIPVRDRRRTVDLPRVLDRAAWLARTRTRPDLISFDQGAHRTCDDPNGWVSSRP